ncbi:xylosyltransferase 1 isoform X1 [Strongylocentrotus purpuratus]|uniref:protein xylosyltransferase n=1 Tax=Strongylocentrotus purpuratus TaxID=7668 RepID=A0A7M7NRU5_STRPU|nr:xylosyltransferase 1 isoform X1 [Strongylocentrotus purpuratus]
MNKEPVDQEVSNQIGVNSAHKAAFVHQAPNIVASNSSKSKHYRSKLVRVTPTGNATLVLEYMSKCPIESKDAISALSRARSKECKKDITDTVCATSERNLYPLSLPRFCPFTGKYANEIENDGKFMSMDQPRARIAYVLVVHGRALRQVRRLIRLLYHRDHFFYIHVDQRSDYLHREISAISERFSNIRVTPWRYATIWGGASLLQVYLRAIDDLIQMKDVKWDFFINLSESDFPIKTNELLVAFLTKNREFNFLKSHGRDDSSRFIKKQGLDRLFYECDNHMWRLGDRELPQGIHMDGGSDWITLNYEFAKYISEGDDSLLKGLKQFYKYTLLPAESFFHTVIQNSRMCDSLVDNNLRVTNWKRKLGCQCQYKHIVDWCGCSPNDFKPADFYKIKTARPAYFARKFEPVINQEVINQLETWLYGNYPVGTPAIEYYWQNSFHEQDTTTVASDAERTFYHAIVRLMAKYINIKVKGSTQEKECRFKVMPQPFQVHYIFRHDSFHGLVASVSGYTDNGQSTLMEAWLSPHKPYRVVSEIGPFKRLVSMEVGLVFDPKERVFRKFEGVIGPHDDPTIFIKWNLGEAYTVTLTWFDPTDHIAASFDTGVEHDREETHHKPEFNKPIRPGKWTIKLLFNWMIVAEIDFLVVPLSIKNGMTIKGAGGATVNNGPTNNEYVSKDFSAMRYMFTLRDTPALLVEAKEKALKQGPALLDWIDSELESFWNVMAFCTSSPSQPVRTKMSDLEEEEEQQCEHFRPCEQQHWSSLSPDPKSELGPIKPNGRIR